MNKIVVHASSTTFQYMN